MPKDKKPRPKKDDMEAKIDAQLQAMERRCELVKLTCERCDETIGYAEVPETPAAYCEPCGRTMAREHVEAREDG